MLRKIRLYGDLVEQCGGREVLEAEIQNPADAIRMLLANFPKLELYMAERWYRVCVGNEDISFDEMHYPVGQQEIKIVPVIAGSGGNTTRILLGVALIAVAIAVPTVGVGLGTGSGFTTAAGLKGAAAFWAGTAALAGNIGIALTLSGVYGMLTPVPGLPSGADSIQDPRKSFSFSGIQNTSRAGTPVPIVMGLTLTGSVVISASTDTVQVIG